MLSKYICNTYICIIFLFILTNILRSLSITSPTFLRCICQPLETAHNQQHFQEIIWCMVILQRVLHFPNLKKSEATRRFSIKTCTYRPLKFTILVNNDSFTINTFNIYVMFQLVQLIGFTIVRKLIKIRVCKPRVKVGITDDRYVEIVIT